MEALDILRFLQYHPLSSRKNIAEGIGFAGSDATLKRLLSAQVSAGKIMVSGQGKATRYSLTSSC
ncbi:MAG: cell filamentation protein Fic, partial [Bacteroidales bacterium]|nr:cell filamentation protein Fic [Bacteroidales bacterium]